MSASACIVFYGVRHEASPEEVEALLEGSSIDLIVSAKRVGLDVYWANFGGEAERFLVFVGKRVGSFGIEDLQSRSVTHAELDAMAAKVQASLKEAGIVGPVALHCEWEADV
jgi:hypothetical protein